MGRAFEYRRASKEKRWDKMSKIFPRLGKTITIAAKAGGPDPDTNSALRTAIMNAKAENMPKTNIEAAIKRASGKDAENFDEINYEGKGPHGVLIFVECATDNNTRTVANIKNYISKAGGQLSPTGSLEFMFSRKAVFQFEKPANLAVDDIELELIDAGLEDIEEHEGEFFAYGDFTSFGALSTAFEKLGVNVTSATLKRFPNTPVEFSEEHLADIEKLIDRIEDDEDVQAVYTNIA
jgi:YebC/PmpR family DNA-binding regulatory protein